MSGYTEKLAVAPAPESEFLRLSRLLRDKGVNLREVYPGRLTRIFGNEGGGATVVFLGENAFANPDVLLDRIKAIFGSVAPLVLNQLIDRAHQVLNDRA